jgi:hypothetical protein
VLVYVAIVLLFAQFFVVARLSTLAAMVGIPGADARLRVLHSPLRSWSGTNSV